jgi:hypothetical protein
MVLGVAEIGSLLRTLPGLRLVCQRNCLHHLNAAYVRLNIWFNNVSVPMHLCDNTATLLFVFYLSTMCLPSGLVPWSEKGAETCLTDGKWAAVTSTMCLSLGPVPWSEKVVSELLSLLHMCLPAGLILWSERGVKPCPLG